MALLLILNQQGGGAMGSECSLPLTVKHLPKIRKRRGKSEKREIIGNKWQKPGMFFWIAHPVTEIRL